MGTATEPGRDALSSYGSSMPMVSFIVARTFPGNVIGHNNELPWKLSSDLKRFRRITTGHSVVMGAKTFHSIGRPLPDRINVILTRSEERTSGAALPPPDTNTRWACSPDEALLIADLFSILQQRKEFFVIGGAQIFEIYEGLAERIYLTEVQADVKGDAFFPMVFDQDLWNCVEQQELSANSKDEFDSIFRIYDRRRQRHRNRASSDFDRLAESRPELARPAGRALDLLKRL